MSARMPRADLLRCLRTNKILNGVLVYRPRRIGLLHRIGIQNVAYSSSDEVAHLWPGDAVHLNRVHAFGNRHAMGRWTGLVLPGETPRPHRLYLMQPYSPDRIPIIMVHGLRSTPLAWQELTNELMGDPVLGRRYQVWHYLYPTGLPFLTSAADFRDELEAV